MPKLSKPEPALQATPEDRAGIAAILVEDIGSSFDHIERLIKDARELAQENRIQEAFSQLTYMKARLRHLDHYLSRLHYLDHDLRQDQS